MDTYSRMYECVRYVQHHDLMEMVFECLGARGHVEVFVMPEYLSLGFGIYPANTMRQVGFTFSLTFEQDITSEANRDGSVVCVRFADGSGYSLVSTGSDISVAGNTVTITGTVEKCKENTFSGISVLIVPSKQASLSEGEAIYAARNLECTATVNGKETPALYDSNGYLCVYEKGLKVQDIADPQSLMSNDWNRSVIRVANPTDQTVRVPMQFFTPSISSPQQCPVIRDIQTGQPVGLSVQSSVNFHAHEGLAESSPKNYYTGLWLRYYTLLTLAPGQVLEFEYLSE